MKSAHADQEVESRSARRGRQAWVPVNLGLLALVLALGGVALSSPPRAGAVASSAAGRDTTRAFPFYRRGLALYSDGKPIEALRQFQNATFFDPTNAEFRFAQGLCLLKVEEYGQARTQFERAIVAAPDHARAHYNLGLAEAALGDSADARHHFLRATALDPHMPGVAWSRAQLAEKGGDPAGAIAALREERVVSPDSASTRAALGQAFARAGRPDSALAEFDVALALAPGPGRTDVLVERARALDALDRPVDAARGWRQAAQRDTARADLRAAEGVDWFRAGHPDSAIAAFDRAMALDPRDARSAFNRGVALESVQRLDDATASYRDAIARDSAYADPWLNLGSLLARQGKAKEAGAALDQWLALAPDSPRAPEIRRARASLLRKRG